MSSPTVSVIMPAYNHERYVGEAIQSVLDQTFEDFEFIILNDGSTDNTEKIINGFHDKRIKYYSHANMDASNTINKGISIATGKYISIINSDDVYHKERFDFLIDASKKTGAMLLCTGMKTIDSDSVVLKDLWYNALIEFYHQSGSFELTLLQGNIARTTSNFFVTSSVFKEIGNLRHYRYVHDYDFILRAIIKYKDLVCFYPDKQLLYYRIHGKNTVSEAPPKVRQECFTAFFELLPDLMEHERDKNKLSILCQRFKAFQDEISAYYNNQLLQKDQLITYKDEIIAEVYSSKSWKITAPLRLSYDMLKTFKIKRKRAKPCH